MPTDDFLTSFFRETYRGGNSGDLLFSLRKLFENIELSWYYYWKFVWCLKGWWIISSLGCLLSSILISGWGCFRYSASYFFAIWSVWVQTLACIGVGIDTFNDYCGICVLEADKGTSFCNNLCGSLTGWGLLFTSFCYGFKNWLLILWVTGAGFAMRIGSAACFTIPYLCKEVGWLAVKNFFCEIACFMGEGDFTTFTERENARFMDFSKLGLLITGLWSCFGC